MKAKTLIMVIAVGMASIAPLAAQASSLSQNAPQTMATPKAKKNQTYHFNRCVSRAYRRCILVPLPGRSRSACRRIALRQCGQMNQL